MKPILCIAGPTASGKSGFAVDIAKLVDGEIINADAMQVYGPLQILSARPSAQDMAALPHHLYGHVDGGVRYSVGGWLREVEPLILEILARGKVPIMTGGTGLYFKALSEGLADVPAISLAVERRVQEVLDKDGVQALRQRCEAIDPVVTSRIVGDNPHRLMRVLSVFWQSGRSLSDWQSQTRPVIPARYLRCAVLMPERAQLYDRINARYAAMVDNGGLDEARAVMALDLPSNLPMMKAIGLPPLLDYLRGLRSYEAALAQSQQDTRRYAKRQMTWFRNQTPHWPKLRRAEEKLDFIAAMRKLCEDGV